MLDITQGAKQDLLELFGVIDQEEITDRLSKSAPVTHSLGNRRHLDLVFLLKKGALIQVGLYESGVRGRDTFNKCKACFGTGKVLVPNICAYCDGEGCSHCKGTAAHCEVNCPEPNCNTKREGNLNHGMATRKQRTKRY